MIRYLSGFAMHPGSYSPDVENKPNSVVVQELRYTGQQPIKPVVDPAKVAPPPPPERIPQPDLVPSTPPTPEPQIPPPAPARPAPLPSGSVFLSEPHIPTFMPPSVGQGSLPPGSVFLSQPQTPSLVPPPPEPAPLPPGSVFLSEPQAPTLAPPSSGQASRPAGSVFSLEPTTAPMRAPPGGGPRTTMTGTLKTITSSQKSNPVVETRRPGAEPLSEPVYWADPSTPAPAASKRVRADTRPFLEDQLAKISNPSHPLYNLVVEVGRVNNKPVYGWRTTTFTTKAGEELTGRYEGSEHGVTVQVGHRDAFASGAPEFFMLEDADLNQVSGQVIESKGAYSYKEAVLVGPPGQEVVVELASLLMWERLGVVPIGTALNAKKVP